MNDNRPNVPCPHTECFQGSVDTGREDERTGEPILKLCPICGGSAFLTAEQNDRWMDPPAPYDSEEVRKSKLVIPSIHIRKVPDEGRN